jgi:hypothetical protein
MQESRRDKLRERSAVWDTVIAQSLENSHDFCNMPGLKLQSHVLALSILQARLRAALSSSLVIPVPMGPAGQKCADASSPCGTLLLSLSLVTDTFA